MKKTNFADLLLNLGNATATEEDYNFLLDVLPPVITNYKEGEGFDAFLGGDALDFKFCKIAKKTMLIFSGYAKTSDGQIVKLISSIPAFRHHFIN